MVMTYSFRSKRRLLPFLLAGALFLCSGCQAIKKLVVKPPPEGFVQDSTPEPAFYYTMSAMIKAPPEDLSDTLLGDLSWIERGTSSLRIDLHGSADSLDISQVGKSFRFDTYILGLKLPCRATILRYKPDREVWILISIEGSWVLYRFKMTPAAQGSHLEMGVIGQASETLSTIIGQADLLPTAAGWMDLMVAHIQADFDPGLDPREITSRGIRGDYGEVFLQNYEVRGWTSAGPDEIEKWLLQPDNSSAFLEEFHVERKYYERFQKMEYQEVLHAPAVFESGVLRMKTDVFPMKNRKGRVFNIRVFLPALEQIVYFDLEAVPERGGSMITAKVCGEVPGAGDDKGMDFLIFAAGIPRMMQEKLMMVKNGVEQSL